MITNFTKLTTRCMQFTAVYTLRVLHSKTVPIKPTNILPEISRPNPWIDIRSVITIRLNIICGNIVNHLLATKFSSRTNNFKFTVV
mgnify:CR=1 FL=1